MHIPTTLATLAWLAAAVILPGELEAQRMPSVGSDLASVLKRYKTCLARKPFLFHTEARQRLARTGEAKALKILLADYAKPKSCTLAPRPDRPIYLPRKRPTPSYVLYSRYTIATLFAQHYDDGEWDEQLSALRHAHTRPSDAWLWVCTLGADSPQDGIGEAVAVARESKRLHLRAAAIEALARRGNGIRLHDGPVGPSAGQV